MNTPAARAACAAVYEQLLQAAYPAGCTPVAPALSRSELVNLWCEARLGQQGATLRHGGVRVLDFGTPNPSDKGPAILRADLECAGQRLRGDITLHARAEEWESEGCGESAACENVVLHVVLQAPAAGWFTRTATHRDVPVWVVPTERLRAVCGCARLYPSAAASRLSGLSAERMNALFRAAAAYRAERKAAFFKEKAAVIGTEQAWFEAWAEVLGYAANKQAMRHLARRAPLRELQRGDAEAILLGTAGFLQPVLPERATEEARAYHRRVWGAWWQVRENYTPEGTQPLPWVLAPVRPMNHPTRRVAALALSAQRWDTLYPLMNAAGAKRLTEALCSLSHPFWDTHCTLAAAPLRRPCALVGTARAADFLANVVYPQDSSAAAWETYLALRAKETPRKIEKLAHSLFGERSELPALLKQQYAQQGILQLTADFGDSKMG